MIQCHHCHAETSNGLALCDACRVAVVTYLEFLPIYYRNLARQRRPARPNGSLSNAGQWMLRRGDVEGSNISTALTRASTTLAGWAEKLGHATPDADSEADTFAAVCELLEGSVVRIAATDNAGHFVRDIARHEGVLRGLTETIVPGWYAGACQQPAGRDMEGNNHICGTSTYVVPGLTWVTCRRCGATTRASDRLDVILAEASGWIAPPMRLAEALVVLVDTEHSIDRLYRRIKIWGQRGRVPTVRKVDAEGDPTGPRKYRLGDVLARLTTEGPSYDLERIYRERRNRITGQAA